MTMKLSRRSAFRICTKAPATAAPDASVMTPVKVPAAPCAATGPGQETAAANATAAKAGLGMLSLPRSLDDRRATKWWTRPPLEFGLDNARTTERVIEKPSPTALGNQATVSPT